MESFLTQYGIDSIDTKNSTVNRFPLPMSDLKNPIKIETQS
jgi:hypothetical protein